MAGSSVNKCWANKLCLQMNEVHAPWLRCQGVRAPLCDLSPQRTPLPSVQSESLCSSSLLHFGFLIPGRLEPFQSPGLQDWRETCFPSQQLAARPRGAGCCGGGHKAGRSV